MTVGTWLRVIDAVSGLSDLTRRIRGMTGGAGSVPPVDEGLAPGSRMLGQVEARLAGVVVAALKEAFERDSARMELERAQVEADRRRAEEALKLEMVRQAGDRELALARVTAGIALVAWIVSALLVARLGSNAGPRVTMLLAAGWVSLLGAAACTFVVYGQITSWLSQPHPSPGVPPRRAASKAGPALLLVGLALIGASLLFALT